MFAGNTRRAVVSGNSGKDAYLLLVLFVGVLTSSCSVSNA